MLNWSKLIFCWISGLILLGGHAYGMTSTSQKMTLEPWPNGFTTEQKVIYKKQLFSLNGHEATKILLNTLKHNRFPIEQRWSALIWLGQLMGKDALPVVEKFLLHPDWMMRLASLKVMAALGVHQNSIAFKQALKDPSLIVRQEAQQLLETPSAK